MSTCCEQCLIIDVELILIISFKLLVISPDIKCLDKGAIPINRVGKSTIRIGKSHVCIIHKVPNICHDILLLTSAAGMMLTVCLFPHRIVKDWGCSFSRSKSASHKVLLLNKS